MSCESNGLKEILETFACGPKIVDDLQTLGLLPRTPVLLRTQRMTIFRLVILSTLNTGFGLVWFGLAPFDLLLAGTRRGRTIVPHGGSYLRKILGNLYFPRLHLKKTLKTYVSKVKFKKKTF